MKKKVLKFTALIGLIFFALNTDVLAENSDDSRQRDGDYLVYVSRNEFG